MRQLVNEEDIKCSPRIQLTMLMHDLGKIVLINHDPSFSEAIQKQVATIAELGAADLPVRA